MELGPRLELTSGYRVIVSIDARQIIPWFHPLPFSSLSASLGTATSVSHLVPSPRHLRPEVLKLQVDVKSQGATMTTTWVYSVALDAIKTFERPLGGVRAGSL